MQGARVSLQNTNSKPVVRELREEKRGGASRALERGKRRGQIETTSLYSLVVVVVFSVLLLQQEGGLQKGPFSLISILGSGDSNLVRVLERRAMAYGSGGHSQLKTKIDVPTGPELELFVVSLLRD